MRNIVAVAKVFVTLFLRDKLNLFFSFFFNAFLMIMLGFFVNNRFDEIGSVGVYDSSESQFSHQFIQVLKKEPNLKIQVFADSLKMFSQIAKGQLVAGIKIGQSFASLQDSGITEGARLPQLKIYGNSGKEIWLRMLGPGIKMAVLKTNPSSREFISRIGIETQMIQSRNLDYFKFIFPGVLVFSIMGLSFTGALSLLFFRKADVLKRLKITPLKKYEFLAGFVSSYFLLLLLQAILYIFIAWLVFGYVFTGNYLQIGILICSCGLLFIVLGVTIANIVPSLDFGNNIIRFLNFPASFLCGIFIPVESLPKVLGYFSVVHPLTYFAQAMRNAVNYDATFSENAANYVIIFLLLIVLGVISVITFQWEERS